MHWWVITVICICLALMIQYLCSSKLLHMKQAISVKSIALREARSEGQRLEEQSAELKNQQTSLTHGIERLRVDIRRLRTQMKEKDLPIPEPSFDVGILGEEEPDPPEDAVEPSPG